MRSNRSKMAKAVGATVFATVVAGSLFASNWPQFRGPTGLGYTDEKELPVKWSKNENVLWKSPLNGQGHASPIVWGDSIFVCTANWPSNTSAREKVTGCRYSCSSTRNRVMNGLCAYIGNS